MPCLPGFRSFIGRPHWLHFLMTYGPPVSMTSSICSQVLQAIWSLYVAGVRCWHIPEMPRTFAACPSKRILRRRDNRTPFWSVFREIVPLCRQLDLFGRARGRPRACHVLDYDPSLETGFMLASGANS